MMDKTEFTAAVLEAEQTLYRVAKTMLGSEHDCADAAQQAILRAWEQLGTLRNPKYFKTWLTRILINECNAMLRQRQRLAPYEPEIAEAIPAPAPEGTVKTRLRAAREQLRKNLEGACFA